MLRGFCLTTLFLTSLLANAGPDTKPVTGTVGADCLPGWEFVLQLNNMPGGARAYLIHYGTNPDTWEPPLHQTLEFVGKVYSMSDQHLSRQMQSAKVTFDQFGAKKASGTYDVMLPDGSRQQGSFRVTRRRLTKQSVCM